MFNFEISQKLADYLNKIETETGHQIKIMESPDVGLKGMWAAFRYHPQFILIIIRSGVKKTHPDFERSIAHEATHGYLVFKKEYCRPIFKPTVKENEKRDISLLFSMVDDIVVNRIIQENGFQPFGSEYLPMVEREIQAEIEGEDFYIQFSSDTFFDTLLMVSRYIIAWAFLSYFDLELGERKIVGKFVKLFQKSYEKEYQIASQIKEIILKNDIFSSRGQCRAIYEVLKIWKLEDLVKLETI